MQTDITQHIAELRAELANTTDRKERETIELELYEAQVQKKFAATGLKVEAKRAGKGATALILSF